MPQYPKPYNNPWQSKPYTPPQSKPYTHPQSKPYTPPQPKPYIPPQPKSYIPPQPKSYTPPPQSKPYNRSSSTSREQERTRRRLDHEMKRQKELKSRNSSVNNGVNDPAFKGNNSELPRTDSRLDSLSRSGAEKSGNSSVMKGLSAKYQHKVDGKNPNVSFGEPSQIIVDANKLKSRNSSVTNRQDNLAFKGNDSRLDSLSSLGAEKSGSCSVMKDLGAKYQPKVDGKNPNFYFRETPLRMVDVDIQRVHSDELVKSEFGGVGLPMLKPSASSFRGRKPQFFQSKTGLPLMGEGWLTLGTISKRSEGSQRAVSGAYNTIQKDAVKTPWYYDPYINKYTNEFGTKRYYDASHLLADSFGFPGEKYNLVPLPRGLNRKNMSQVENDLRKRLKDGEELFMQTYVNYEEDFLNYTGNCQIPCSMSYRIFNKQGELINEDSFFTFLIH